MATQLTEQLQEIDRFIKNGEIVEAKKKLGGIQPKRVPRLQLAAFCQLYRRLRMPLIPLQALNPIVRSTKPLAIQATAEEKLEYSICLIEVGSAEEALSILRTIDPVKTPRTLISQAFAHFSHWNYRASLPLLLQYTESSGLTDYERLIGNVNLLGALVHEKKPMAETLIPQLISQTEGKFKGLYANILLSAAEYAIFQKDWKEANRLLDKASEVFGGGDSHGQLFIFKWRALIEVLNGKKNRHAIFEKVRGKAAEIHHWETVRDCDRLEAILEKDRDLYLKVHFGTPWENYREWIAREFKGNGEIPDEYVRHFEGEKSGKAQVLDYDLKERKLLFRLYAILNRDFYQPVRIASVHSLLYPDEFYNPFSSPNRIHQIVDRLRAWLKQKKSPLTIIQEVGGYKIEATRSCKIVIRDTTHVLTGPSSLLIDLQKAFPKGTAFTSEEACEKLNVSSRSMRRFLKASVQSGSLKREGKTRGAKYTF